VLVGRKKKGLGEKGLPPTRRGGGEGGRKREVTAALLYFPQKNKRKEG